MDQKLLQALNNVGLALESLVEAIESDKESKSATADAIKSGNFGKQLESITVELKSIKADTQQILKNQETIISLSKEKEKEKTSDIKDAGSKDQKESIKKGVGTILLIAGAVLAIGLAFKIVGEVDFLSVISLSLAVTIMALAFERIGNMNLTLAGAAITSLAMVMMSAAIVGSAYFLSKVEKVEKSNIVSAIMISGVFLVLSYGLKNILGAFEGVDIISLIAGAIFLPIILVSISKAIADSSRELSNVEMIGIESFFGSILVSAIFVVLSYSLRNMIGAFKGINPVFVTLAALFLPTILVSISQAIADSSEILSSVKMMSLESFFGSILVSAIFVVLSYGIKRMISAFKDINPKTAAVASLTIPILMVAISGAIWASSHILDKMVIVDNEKLINAGLVGGGLALITMVMAPTLKILSKVDTKDLVKATLVIPALALLIMISSHILALGKYEEGAYPSYDWVGGVALALLVFGGAVIGLGFLITASAGLGLPALALGGVGALIVAATIAASSHALKLGDYKTSYPGLDWAKGVSLSLLSFGTGMTVLGGIIFSSFGVGLAMLKAGSNAVLMVAKTIVGASDILANGYTDDDGNLMKPNYVGGPTKEWSEGVSLAIGAFSPVYGMLMKNKLLSFLGGGVGPDDFTDAIKTVSQGVVAAASFFASPENKGVWGGHPTKKWSEGVGLAIGAFAPVYEILAGQSWLSKDIDAEDFAGKFDSSGKLIKDGAIQVISRGIVSAAQFFAENTAPFDEGKYPSKKWGEGVGAALGAFSPIFEALQDKSWYKSSKSVVNNMANGIMQISSSLVNSAKLFSGYTYDWKTSTWQKGEDVSGLWGSYPNKSWSSGVAQSVSGFLDIFDELENRGYTTSQFATLSDILTYGVSGMSRAARVLHKNKDFFNVELNPNFIENISKNVLGFAKLGLSLDQMLVSEKIITKENSGFFGIGASKEAKTVRETKDLGIVDMVVGNLVRVAMTLFFNKNYFEDTSIYDNFYKDVVSTSTGIIARFSSLINMLNLKENLSLSNLTKIVPSLVKSAQTLFFNKEFFTETSAYSGFYKDVVSTSTGIISRFSNLVNMLNSEEDLSFWNLTRTVSNLVRTAKILHSGQDFFGLSIDPNYIKNVSQNIIDFNNLVKQLVESESDKSFLNKVGDVADSIFGTDPISQIARRMITLAEGYDALANSLNNLGTAMKTLNITDVRMLGGITKTLVSSSPDLNVSDDNDQFTNDKATTSVNTSTTGTLGQKNVLDNEDVSQKLDEVIRLLSNIDKSTGSVDSIINEALSDEDAKESKGIFSSFTQ